GNGGGGGEGRVRTMRSGVLRWRERRSGGARSSATPGRNESSATASIQKGREFANANASRPASHADATAARGRPPKPFAPVQPGTAVSRNPASAAPTKP